MMADLEQPEQMTYEQAAARLGVSVVTIREWVHDGKLRAGWLKLHGRNRRIVRTADVEKLFQQRQTGEVRWEQ